MTTRKVITIDEARMAFPGAVEAIEADGGEANWFEFTVDRRGKLHVDDAVHPCCDDVWNANDRVWEGGL